MNMPFDAQFRLLKRDNTVALADQSMMPGLDSDLLPWVGAYVMSQASGLFPPSQNKAAIKVSISGHCEEVTYRRDYSIKVREPVIEVTTSEYTEQDDLLFNNCPF